MNLVATGRSREIVDGRSLLLPPAVVAEAVFIYVDGAHSQRLQLDQALFDREGLQIAHASLTVEERKLAVRYAMEVDDGEAQTLAIAKHRAMTILTDDNGGLRFARVLGIEVATTLDLIRKWAGQVTPDEVRMALRAMRDRANYAVPRRHPLASWYASQLDEDEDRPS